MPYCWAMRSWPSAGGAAGGAVLLQERGVVTDAHFGLRREYALQQLREGISQRGICQPGGGRAGNHDVIGRCELWAHGAERFA